MIVPPIRNVFGWAPDFLAPFLVLWILFRKKTPKKKGRPLGRKDSYKRKTKYIF